MGVGFKAGSGLRAVLSAQDNRGMYSCPAESGGDRVFQPTKIITAGFLTVALAALAAAFLQSDAGLCHAREPLLIANHPQPPLTTPQGDGPVDRVILEMFARIGLPARLVPMPYERSLVEASAGTIDGESSRLVGLERLYPGLVMVPESTYTQDFSAFAARPGIRLDGGWESLAPYHVGYLIGWKVLEENVTGESVTTVPDAKSLFAMLAHGRIDIAVYERISGAHLARDLGMTGIYALEPPLLSQKLYLYLNTKHEALVPALAKALRDMKADGTYAAIYKALEGK